MEAFLFALLLIVACVAVGVAAKNGAERELRRREERWARVPASNVPHAFEGAAVRGLAPRGRASAERGAPAAGGAPGVPAPAAHGAQPAAPSGPAPRPPVRRARAAEPTIVERPRPRARPAPQVNINEAGLDELRNLPGVGVRAAERILAHREQHGPFESVQGLEAVEGFDAHRIGRLSQRATV